MTRWTVAVGAVLAGCLAADAAAGESVATALRLGADTPELRQLAEHWRGHRAELLARLALPDPEERQGAARLCALVGVGDGMTAAALLAALVASSDGEVRRLGTYGLLDHLDGIPPARLLALGDAALVCQLLGAYPSRDALADLAVQKQLVAWLHDPAACDAVAVLITIQGNAQTWGPQLVEVIEAAAKEPDSPVQQHLVATAHQALCVLTRTQRGLAPYAGYYDLLAKDWRDALAEKPALASGPADADLLALIRALPGPASVRALLGRGSSVLPALEQAMIGADRQRRTQLQAAARLVARAVSPSLYDDLGDAGLEGMDADSVAERLKALARAAEAVLRTADAPGLVHLVTYLDDHDTVVRTAALDRLVRLSDEHKRFHDHWTLEEKGNFPPGPCLWRLRRSLKLGGRDEQVAALQFTASLRANELSDDVVALLLSPSPMVVETALETLGHLQAIAHVAMLMRLAGDRSQPAPRRARILELITRMLSQNSNDAATKASDEVARSVQQLLAAETDTLVLGAARKAQFQTARTPKEQRDALLAMLGKGGSDRAAALRLLAEHAVATEHNRTSGGNRPPLLIIDLALPYLFDGDRDTAVLAAEALVEAMDNRKRSTEIAALFTQAMRADLVQWCTHHEGAWPGHLALAATLRAIPRPQLIALVRGLTGDDVAMPWLALIASATDAQAVLDEVLAAEGAGAQIGEHALNTLITTVLGAGLLHPAQLKAVLAIGAFDLLPGGQDSSTETNYGQNGQGYTATRVIALPDGETLRLAGTKRKGDETEYGDSSFDWTSQPPGLAHAPDDAGVQRLASGLSALSVPQELTGYRDLVVCVLAHTRPAAALSSTVPRHGEIWRLLVKRDPTLRPLLVTGVQSLSEMWYLRPFLELGNPDLLPMVAKSLASEENDWSIQGFVPYLASLEPSALESQLPTILANPLVAKNDKIREMLGHLAHMPLSVALEMLTQEGQPAITAIAAYGEDQLPALGKVFTAMKPEEVLAGAPLLRILRDASQAVFDKAMVPLLERKDATSAAWLRTNIPFQDGLKAYYAQALKSDVPELWLVGAAITLREGGYSSHEFLVKAAALPQASLIDAAIVTTRYLSGKLAGEGEALARILAACQDRALSSWLAIVPPDPALASVLAQRAADPAAANIIAMSLAPRLGQNRASWLPIVQAVVQAAHGKLNYLLPESERR